MSLLNTKFINDGVPLTIEDIGVSSSFANDVAYNEYNLTTSIENEAKKSFYNDNPKLPNKEYFKALFGTDETIILHSGRYDKREVLELATMFVNDSMPTKPFKSTAIDIKEFNGGYSFQEKPLSNAEIKEFVEINGSNLDTKGLDNLSRLAVIRMIADKKKDELSSVVSQFRKDGFINDVSYYGSGFLGQLSSPTELIAGLGIGTVAKSGVKTLAKMTVTGGRPIATTSGLSKTKGMLKNVIKSKVKKGAKFAERKLDISTPATKLGRIGKTAGVGATYGLIESLVTEPLFYKMAQNRQDNYDIDDSLLNIMFGSLAGGVLGGIGGAISKTIKPKSMEHISNERQVDIITTAHNQIMAGKPIDIDHIVNLDPKTHYMNAVEKNKEALTTIKAMNKKGSDKVLVENEVPPETLDYKRLDSQIANLREVIQNLRVKMKTKDNPVNNEKFETKVKEVEKVLNKGHLPDFDTLPPLLKREVLNGEFINKDPVADAAIDDLLKPKVEEPPVELSKEPDVTEVLEEPNAEVNAEVSKIYNDMKDKNMNEIAGEDTPVNLEALDDVQFTALIDKIKGCRV